MNRLEDAVRDLLSSVPPATSVDGLRTRIRRHRRRRALAIVAVAGVVCVASVGVAASLGHKSSSPRIDVSPTTTAVPSRWCVPISREAAIARVMKLSNEVAPSDTAQAKLVSWPELRASRAKSTTSPYNSSSWTAKTQFWAVEVRGSVTPSFAMGDHGYAWGIFDVDAHSGDIPGMTAGPAGSSPSFWDSLPDHASECTSPSTTPTTTSYRGPWLVPPQDVPKASGALPPPSVPTVLPPSATTLATAHKALSLLPAGFKITDTHDLVFADGTRNARVGFTAPGGTETLGLFWVQLSKPEPMSPFGLGPGPVTYHRTPSGELVTVDGSQHRSSVFVTPTGLEYVAQYMSATVGPRTTQPSMPIAELARFLTTLVSSP